jgi:hypothetical protein
MLIESGKYKMKPLKGSTNQPFKVNVANKDGEHDQNFVEERAVFVDKILES